MEPLEEKQPAFSWWMVTGAGGSGKSRLCFEFGNLLRRYGWTVCAPSDHREGTLKACSARLPNHTLFILDYAEYDTAAIGRWLNSFFATKYNHIRVRVLLIQRVCESLESVLPKGDPNERLRETVYPKDNGFLRLEPLKETDLREIMGSTRRNTSVSLYWTMK